MAGYLDAGPVGWWPEHCLFVVLIVFSRQTLIASVFDERAVVV